MRRILAARYDFVLLAAISVAYQIAAKERSAIPGVGTAGGFTFIRLRSASVGPYLPRSANALEQRRFSRDTIRRYIRGADSLYRWLDDQGVAVVEANQGHIERYVCQHA